MEPWLFLLAIRTTIIAVIATSSGAAAADLRSGLTNIRIGLFLAMATVEGAIIGADLVGVVPERVLELILGLALAYSAAVTMRQLGLEIPENPGRRRAGSALRAGRLVLRERLDREVKYRAVRGRRGFGAMFGAGLLSRLLGIGSGAFKVLAMDHFMRLPMKVSTATSNFMIGITAAASAAIYFRRGDIHPLIVTPVALGVIVGAYLGTRLMARLRNTTVRKLFLHVVFYSIASARDRWTAADSRRRRPRRDPELLDHW